MIFLYFWRAIDIIIIMMITIIINNDDNNNNNNRGFQGGACGQREHRMDEGSRVAGERFFRRRGFERLWQWSWSRGGMGECARKSRHSAPLRICGCGMGSSSERHLPAVVLCRSLEPLAAEPQVGLFSVSRSLLLINRSLLSTLRWVLGYAPSLTVGRHTF